MADTRPGWTAEEITEGITGAVKAKDFEAVVALLKLLTLKDPHQAEIVYTAMMTVLETASSR